MPSAKETTAILNDGRELTLAWLAADQAAKFSEFFSGLSEDDIRHLSLNPKDSGQLQRWLAGLERGNLFILAARDPEESLRLAGYCALKLGRGAHGHMAQVETFLHPDYRDLGLGSNLIKEAASLGSRRKLDFLEAEVHVEDRPLMDALKNLGFELKAIIEDYRVDCSGLPYDVIIMLKRLSYPSKKEFLYRY
jgi:ribosomal protein S18 acetylase RimI-like enzyme